jgi:hypothetical protein
MWIFVVIGYWAVPAMRFAMVDRVSVTACVTDLHGVVRYQERLAGLWLTAPARMACDRGLHLVSRDHRVDLGQVRPIETSKLAGRP